jgi:DNA primase
MYFKRESLQELRNLVDPKEVLIHIGGVSPATIKDNGYELRCPCPMHQGDNPTGFSWKKSDGVWTCFTKNCGKEGGRDVYSFTMQKLGVSFKEAAEKLASMFGYSLEEGEMRDYSAYLQAAETRKDYQALHNSAINELKPLETLPGYDARGTEYVQQYLKLRRYEDENLIKLFGFYPCLDYYGVVRMGIPAYDEHGLLVGVNARCMDGILAYPEKITNPSTGAEKAVAKYDMVANFKKGQALFNLFRAKQYSLSTEKEKYNKDFTHSNGLVVVEGELSCVRCVSYGVLNTVAMRGSSITNAQAELLYKYGFKTVFLVEANPAAEEGVLKSINKLAGMKIFVAKLKEGDPDDNSSEEVLQCIENARLYGADEINWCNENNRLI